jgi:hypothetical protein
MSKKHKWSSVHVQPAPGDTTPKKDKPAPVQNRPEAFAEGHSGGTETAKWENDG